VVSNADDYSDRLARSWAALERIASAYQGQQILAVTHGGVIRASFVALGKMPEGEANRITSANAAITEWTSAGSVDARGESRWRLVRHRDVAHLLSSGVQVT